MEKIRLTGPEEFFMNIVPLKTIGIDVGHSLTKIALTEENGLSLILFNSKDERNGLIEFLISKKNSFTNINFTGGAAFALYEKLGREFNVSLLDEFSANYRGIERLYKIVKNRELPLSLIVSIGTGTSIVYKDNSIKHLGGTAIGGGFFMGLINLHYKITNFKDALKLAAKGDRYNIDLKVSDIYDKDDNRVDALFREFTAASFSKIDKTSVINKEDVISSLIHLIAENVGMLACLMADKVNIENIVFCGGFTINNKILRKALTRICMIQRKKALFLKNAEYMGAIGALFNT